MPLNSAVQNIFHLVSTIENQFTDLLTCDFSGNEIDRSPMPDIPSLIGKNGQFFLQKLIWDPIYVGMKNKLIMMTHLSSELGTETPDTISIKWLSLAVQWIESVVSKIKVSDQLHISLKDAEELAITGSDLFLNIEDKVKRSFSRHKIVLYTNKNTRNFSVRMARGGATHSVGGYTLRWIEFCFNSLRGDIFLHKDFVRKVDSFRSLDDMSISSLKTLSIIVEEAKSNLLIPPDQETIEAIHKMQVEYNWPTSKWNVAVTEETIVDPQSKICHDLWLK